MLTAPCLWCASKVTLKDLTQVPYSPECVEGVFCEVHQENASLNPLRVRWSSPERSMIHTYLSRWGDVDAPSERKESLWLRLPRRGIPLLARRSGVWLLAIRWQPS